MTTRMMRHASFDIWLAFGARPDAAPYHMEEVLQHMHVSLRRASRSSLQCNIEMSTFRQSLPINSDPKTSIRLISVNNRRMRKEKTMGGGRVVGLNEKATKCRDSGEGSL